MRGPSQREVDEAEMWALMIRDAQISAVTHGTAFLKFTYEDNMINVELLKAHDYMPWGMVNTMETKQ